MINPFDEVDDFKIELKIGEEVIEIVPSEVLKTSQLRNKR